MIFVHTLGTAQIDAGDTRVKPTSVRKFSMLLHLSAERGRRVSRSELHELIFPDQTDKNARHSLRELVYQLRQSGAEIETDKDGVELAAKAVRSDYTDVIERERPDASQLRAAEGGFLPGYAPTHSEAYAEWFEGYRAKLIFDLCKALLKEVARAKAAGDWTITERAARACLALDPLNEEATLALAEMLALGGAKVQAVDLLDRYMADIGERPEALRFSAGLLRHRIREHAAAPYSAGARLPFLGRDREMEHLHRILTRALDGESQCVAILGEPGIGKSRLVTEFTRSAALESARIERVMVQPRDAGQPMGAFVDLVPRLLRLPGSIGCRPVSLQALRALTDVTETAASPMPDVIAHRIVRAITDVVEAISSEQPLILLIEDAHWLDETSLQLLFSLCRGSAPRRLLVLITARERMLGHRQMPHSERLHEKALPRLQGEAAQQLVEAALLAAGLRATKEDVAWIGSLSAGNPLFIESLVSEYARTQDRFAVPMTLTDLLSSRLSGLSADALVVLRMVIVFGKHGSADRLTRALGLSGSELLSAIEELEYAHLLVTTPGALAPAHALIAEAALRQCSPVWLVFAHRQVASTLTEELSSSQSPALLWDCAEHWIAAGENDRAREFLVRCADHASTIGRPQVATEILQRALRLGLERQRSIEITRKLVACAYDAGDPLVAVTGIEALKALGGLATHDDLELIEFWARSRFYGTPDAIGKRLLACVGDRDASDAHRLKAATWALKYADTHGDDDLAAAVCRGFDPNTVAGAAADKLEHSMFRFLAGNDLRGVARTARFLLGALDDLDEWTSIRYRMNVSLALTRSGYETEGLHVADATLLTAVRLEAPRLIFRASLFKSIVLFDAGRDDEAASALEAAKHLAFEFPEFAKDFDFLSTMADIALARGEIGWAGSLLERIANSATDSPFHQRWLRALRIRLRQSSGGEAMSPAEMAELASGPVAGPTSGLCDLEVAAAMIEEIRRGDVEAARETLARYVERRRWKNRYSRCLQVAVAQLADS